MGQMVMEIKMAKKIKVFGNLSSKSILLYFMI